MLCQQEKSGPRGVNHACGPVAGPSRLLARTECLRAAHHQAHALACSRPYCEQAHAHTTRCSARERTCTPVPFGPAAARPRRTMKSRRRRAHLRAAAAAHRPRAARPSRARLSAVAAPCSALKRRRARRVAAVLPRKPLLSRWYVRLWWSLGIWASAGFCTSHHQSCRDGRSVFVLEARPAAASTLAAVAVSAAITRAGGAHSRCRGTGAKLTAFKAQACERA